MNIHEYNKTFYYGLSSLFFLGIISLLTYLFKFKNIQNFINLFILFIVLLLVIYCHATFKNNVIENFDYSGQYRNSFTDISNIQIKNLTVATADEPFGRFNLSFFGFDNQETEQSDLIIHLNSLYNSGFRGFHFYVEYPNNSNKPYCVFPYKNTTGMDSIATRNEKILLTTVVSAIRNSTALTDPCFFCFTCLSREKENELHHINTTLTGINYNLLKTVDCDLGNTENSKDISFKCLNIKGNIVTLGTYDNIPLNDNKLTDHYFIKENDLKYASFNVANKFGVYAPLLNYTKDQQDTFNSRGYDEDIIQSVTLAYENGVQFVCIPPTRSRGKITSNDNDTQNEAYDYPTTVEKCKTYFTNDDSIVCPYKERVSSFVSAIEDIVNTQTNNETRINNIEGNLVSTSDFYELSGNFYDLDSSFNELDNILDSGLEDLSDIVNNVNYLDEKIDAHFSDSKIHLSKNQRRKIHKSKF